jgi:hypothetical protein
MTFFQHQYYSMTNSAEKLENMLNLSLRYRLIIP